MIKNIFESGRYTNTYSEYFVEHLYSVPVYVAHSDPNGPVQTEMQGVLPNIEFGTCPEPWGRTHKLSKSADNPLYFTEDAIKDYKLVEFEKMLNEALDHYYFYFAQRARPTQYKRNSWFTKTEKNDYAAIHNHIHAHISGCYYADTTGDDGTFFFTSPSQGLELSQHFSHLANRIEEKPQVGKLMLFPGFLSHGITTNTTDSSRISLSFNIYFYDE